MVPVLNIINNKDNEQDPNKLALAFQKIIEKTSIQLSKIIKEAIYIITNTCFS